MNVNDGAMVNLGGAGRYICSGSKVWFFRQPAWNIKMETIRVTK